jgi:drug/metabolite transporter (DMT)-like permease
MSSNLKAHLALLGANVIYGLNYSIAKDVMPDYILPFGFIGTQYLFPIELQKEIFGIVFSAKGIFIIGYGFTLLLALIIIYGLKKLSPSVVSTYIYLQPLLATVFAIWAGKDSLDWIKIVAAILIFSGVFMVSKTKTLKNQ